MDFWKISMHAVMPAALRNAGLPRFPVEGFGPMLKLRPLSPVAQLAERVAVNH